MPIGADPGTINWVGGLIGSAVGSLLGGGGRPTPNARQSRALMTAGYTRRNGKWRDPAGNRIGGYRAQQLGRDLVHGRPIPGQVLPRSPDDYGPANAPLTTYPIMAGTVIAATDWKRRKKTYAKKKRAAKRKKFVIPKWITNRFPFLGRVVRYGGPTGVVLAGQDIYRNRKVIEAWAKNPPPRQNYPGPVRRAPGPDWRAPTVAIPGAERRQPSAVPVRRGPIRRYSRANPWQPSPVVPSSWPRSSPGSRRSPAARPSAGATPATLPRPRSASRPASASVPSRRTTSSSAPASFPTITTKGIPTWLKDIGSLAPLFQNRTNQFRQSVTRTPAAMPVGFLEPLTSPQAYPVASPATAKCRCPKPKKRKKSTTCRNPVISRRKRNQGGRILITTTREQRCPA